MEVQEFLERVAWPADQALRHLAELDAIAQRMARSCGGLWEDLRQEMVAAILDQDMGHSWDELRTIATRRGIDFLRSRRRHYSYYGRVPHVSLEALLLAGWQMDTEGRAYRPNGWWLEEEDDSHY